ncbi:ABC transporter permease [Isachenkonia alkalipeptolytica]|uniref:ABC transporter permease n=1 Tax=Isachenkonia alkalipeptolytica TaxID=2565777 RepID=A0AA44BD89_9CLOT|nr:ABC transporter permease [Isachenkonia alkalipeptolytica]NBG86925.1 ABC transporter permease [Isachenkonia alkalipeptolytica]
MGQTFKVALWELKKNLTNKTFLISMALTPLIMIVFGALPTVLESLERNQMDYIYVVDEIGVYEALEGKVDQEQYQLENFEGDVDALEEKAIEEDRTSYIIIDEEGFQSHQFTLHSGDDSMIPLSGFQSALTETLQERKIDEAGIDREVATYITTDFSIQQTSLLEEDLDFLNRLIPGVFAGMILISVFISGTMTFQSATQEKRDKMTEVLLSSVSARDLMQGKIIGYFFLGLIQVGVWAGVGLLVATYYFDVPVLEYLFVSELPLMLLYALIGYLMFSALFVSMGATINDIYSAGNFQGVLFIIPMLPIFFIGAIIQNPHGIVAQVGSYFPLSTPGVMLFRLVIASRVPPGEIILSLGILVITTIFIMRLAGKIFKTALLMYGKNATPAEIFRWARQK